MQMDTSLAVTVESKAPMALSRAFIVAAVLLLSACGGGSSGDINEVESDDVIVEEIVVDDGIDDQPQSDDPNALRDVVEIDNAYAYVRNSPYSNVLKTCAVIDSFRDACTLDVLPFIIQDASEPSVDDVMSRVLVTHDWMGERFEALLRSSDDTLTNMFGSVTSILIGSTVRPSNYWAGTGGIQLDPVYLWMSVEEKMTVSIEEDFRSGFGSELQFLYFQSRLRDGNRVSTTFDLLSDETRTLEDIRVPTLRLLYHELAHANDYLPRTAAPLLDSTLIPSAAIDELFDYWLAPQLANQQPLNSSVLKGLAGVRYRGDDATEAETSMSANFVGSEFAGDGGIKFYSYSTIREDVATLVETAMIKSVLNIDVASAYVDIPSDPDNASCNDYIVAWGTRNRFSDPLVLSRAKMVMEGMFGSSAGLDQFIDDQLGRDDPMQAGEGWCSERDLRSSSSSDIQTQALLSRNATRSEDPMLSTEMSDMDRHAWAEEKRR